MVRYETVFTATDGISSDFAAQLAQRAEQFEATISLECAGKRLNLDSLIGILALEMYRGVKVAITAEGRDEVAAAEDIRVFLEGNG